MIYATDFHGNPKHYNSVLKYAIENDIKLIHIGADILPKGSGMQNEQKKFVKGFLKNYYSKAADKGITVLADFGNDDLYTRKKYFDFAPLLNDKPVEYEGYTFVSYNFVPDYPFGLKTACKKDYPNWQSPAYYSDPVEIGENGFYLIGDIDEYFASKGTIQEDLAKITIGPKTIFSCHCPPFNVGLDVCMDGRKVGSQAVYDFIAKKQPLLGLFGHIHESPLAGTWNAKIGDTICIQPGQFTELKTTAVEISLDDMQFKLLKL